MAKKKDTTKESKVGGLAFFLSLFVLIIISLLNLVILAGLLNKESLPFWLRFLSATILGGAISSIFITGRASVFTHELKHAILSNLVGNKAKGMVYNRDSGHFEYSYTKSTAHYNAFISLAPYFVPLFTIVFLLISLPFWYREHSLLVIAAGVGYGVDFVLNKRDISPRQTDFSLITGGYSIGIIYVLAINTAIFTTMGAWISGGVQGLKYLVLGYWVILSKLVFIFKQ